MERERLELIRSEFGDYTGDGPWDYKGETYDKMDERLIESDVDWWSQSECHNVIIKRRSDNKYFKFDWTLYRDSYYYGNKLIEVFPVQTIKYE